MECHFVVDGAHRISEFGRDFCGEPQYAKFRIAQMEFEDRTEEAVDGLFGGKVRDVGFDDMGGDLSEPLDIAVGECLYDGLLVFEILVQGANGDVGAPRDLVRRGTVKPFLKKQLRRHFDDEVNALLAA